MKKLEGHKTGEIDHLVWSADGQSLLFNEVHGTDTNLFRLHVATDRLEALTRGDRNPPRHGLFARPNQDRLTPSSDFDSPDGSLYARLSMGPILCG